MSIHTEQVIEVQSPTISEKSPVFEDVTPAFAFPPMDYERYKWRSSSSNPKHHFREVFGAELYEELWARLNHGEFTIFFGVDVKKTGTAISNETLIQKARAAWSQLRYAVPTIASQIDHDTEGRVLLTYNVADSSEVDNWNVQTFSVENQISDLNDLRYKIGQTSIPVARGFQVFLRLIPRGDSFGLLLQTHHIVLDGAGLKVLMDKYLRLLVKKFSEIQGSQLEWGNEAKNLEPAMISVLAEDQATEGLSYQRTLGEILTGLAVNQPKAHGLKDGKVTPGNSRRVHHKFDLQESSKLIHASKSKGFTINQIAHAALSMAAAEDSPMTPDSPPEASLLYFNLVNCRDRLAEPIKSVGYTSNCLAMHPVVVPMSSFSSVENFADSSILTNTAELIKSQYQSAKASSALAGVVGQEIELMLSPLLAAASQAEASGVDIPVPTTFGPWFSGDGVVEAYLPDQFSDTSGNTVLDIQDVFISLNIVDPRPFFRIFTFKNQIVLSVDHNENALPSETIDRLLRRWTDLLRLVL